MKELLDGKIWVSISTQKVTDKDSDIWNRLEYEKTQITLSELKNYISNQYAFCGIFNSDCFGQGEKTISNWEYAHIIPVDLDNRIMSYDEFMELIKDSDIAPNMAYRTQNDGIKGNRYRLLYVFEEAIKNSVLYKQIHDGIVRKIEELTRQINDDNCGGIVNQSFAGTNHTDDIFTDIIYYDVKSIKSILKIATLNISDKVNRQNEKRPKNKPQKRKFDNFDFTKYDLMIKDFAIDFNTMSLMDLINKYGNTYPNYEQTPLDEVDEDTAYINIPKDFCEIKRYWWLLEEPQKQNKCPRIRKICDGMGRRKKLFINAILRRFINRYISFDNLLFNIIFEFSFYMINNGNKITKKDLFEITQRAFNADLSNYKRLIIGNRDKKYIVNDAFCVKHNISKKAAVRIAVKQRNAQMIGELYDCTLTDKQNIEQMKEYGLNISLKTLRRWRTDNNISKSKGVDITNHKERRENIIGCYDHTPDDNRTLTINKDNSNIRTLNIMNTDVNKERMNAYNNDMDNMYITKEIRAHRAFKYPFSLIVYKVPKITDKIRYVPTFK